MHSRVVVGLPLFGKSGWLTWCLSRQLLALLLPTKCVQTREMPYRLPKFLLSIRTFSIVQGRKFLSQMPRGHTFSALTVFFDRDCLQALGHIQHFWSWHPSLGRAAFLECVVLLLVHKHHLELYWPNQMFFFQFWRNIDWHFRFKQFVERIRFFSHSGNIVSVVVHEIQIPL